MDYLFFATLILTGIMRLVVSYDIVCQWHKNLWHWMKVIPHEWQVDPNGHISVIFLVPKFHLQAHIEYCHNNYSFNLTPGVGRTDGEGVERGWDHINALAPSTREMGPGSRRDTLDDHFGDRNWKKIVGLGVFGSYIELETRLTVCFRCDILAEDQGSCEELFQTPVSLGTPERNDSLRNC